MSRYREFISLLISFFVPISKAGSKYPADPANTSNSLSLVFSTMAPSLNTFGKVSYECVRNESKMISKHLVSMAMNIQYSRQHP